MLPIASYSYCVYKNQSITFLSACQVLALSSLSAAVPAAWLASPPGYAASMCADCSIAEIPSIVMFMIQTNLILPGGAAFLSKFIADLLPTQFYTTSPQKMKVLFFPC